MDTFRRLVGALPCALALAALALPAAAQEATVPASAPPAAVAQQPTPAPSPTPPLGGFGRPQLAPPTGKRTRWDLLLTAEKSFAIGADQLVPPGTLSDNQIVPGGVLTYNFSPKWRAYVLRRNHEDVGGRNFKGGKPSYGGFSLDIEWDEGVGYAFSRDFFMTEEYMYRYRNCCPNAGDPANKTPRVEQGLRTNATWAVGPETIVGRLVRFHGEGNYVDHHLDLGTGLAAGTPVLGNTWVYKLSAYVYFPIYNQKKVVPFFGFEHFDDFFNNNQVPSWTNRSEYGMEIRTGKPLNYRAYVKNDQQTNPDGDVPHKVTLYLEAALHLQR